MQPPDHTLLKQTVINITKVLIYYNVAKEPVILTEGPTVLKLKHPNTVTV